jgi:peptidyl-prolyl cis-trans isomerase A (cyclophilin A)
MKLEAMAEVKPNSELPAGRGTRLGRRTWLAVVAAPAIGWLAACSKPNSIGPAPGQFKTVLHTSKGDVVILVDRDWAPHGADRFFELVKMGYYNKNYFYRSLKGFVVEWGLNGDPQVSKDWSVLTIKDDTPREKNRRGTVSFAQTEEPNSRTTQVFINLADNPALDEQKFVPFGEVVEGLKVVDSFYMEYGDGPPRGEGPDAKIVLDVGNDYIEHRFNKLDFIKKAQIIE